MKKIINKLILPTAAIVIANIIILIIGKFGYNDWIKFYDIIPKWIFLISLFILIGWILFSFFKQRKKLNRKESYSSFLISGPIYGYRVIGHLIYAGVKWKVRHPNDGPFNRLVEGIKIDNLDVNTTPYCPKCIEMELIEERNIIGKYVWRCLKCGLKRKNKKSAQMLARNEILKIAKSEVSVDLENE